MKNVILFLIVFLMMQNSFAKGREDSIFGVNFSVNQPYPAGVGFNLMIQPTGWFRLNGGAGYYSDTLGSELTDIPIGMIAIMVYMLTGGATPIEDSIEFLKGPVSNPQVIRSYSGGFDLLLPSMKTSPVIGVQWGGFEPENNAMGFTEFQVHKYYKLGVDYLDESGFNFQLGGLYAPELPEALQYRAYTHFGWFF